MIKENLRRPEVWILLVAGVTWMALASDGNLLIAILGAIPGALMVTAGVGSLLFPGERGLARAAGLGGLLGLLLAIPVLLVNPGIAVLLGALAVGGLISAGLLSAADVQLPSDLIAPGSSPRLGAEVGFDEAVLGLTNVLMPPFEAGDPGRIARESAAAGDLFDGQGWLADPRSYHVAPPALEDSEIRTQSRRARGWDYEALSFQSGFEPVADCPGRDRYLSYEKCREAHAWVLRSSPQAPWLVCVHGLGMGYPVIDFTLFPIRLLHRELGLNLVFPTLPMHGPRKRFAVSGRGVLTGEVMDSVLALSQAIWDIRRVLTWVRRQNDVQPGVLGASLGGYTAGLLAGVEEGLAGAVLGIPAADLTSLLWWHAAAGSRRRAEQAGLTPDNMARVMRVVSPLHVTPRIDRMRRYVFAGLVDSLVPAVEVIKLWEHWDRCSIQWYPGAHLSFGLHAQVNSFLAAALRDSLMGTDDGDKRD